MAFAFERISESVLSSSLRYRTGEFLIDLNTREIKRGECVVDVEAKVFDLIALLLQHRDRALSKRELNSALWSDRPVTDAALSQQLRKARRAMGDDGDLQAVIRTVHGHGLRWVAAVDVETAPADLQQPIATTRAPMLPVPAGSQRNKPVAAAIALVCLLVVGAILVVHAVRPPTGASMQRRLTVLPMLDKTQDNSLAWTRVGLMGLMTGLFEQQGGIEIVPAQVVQSVVPANATFDEASLQALRQSLGASHVVVTSLVKLGPVYELDLHLVVAGNAQRFETLHGSEPAALAADAVSRVRRWIDLAPAPATSIGASSPFVAEAYARGLDAQLHGDAAAAKKYFSICLDQDPAMALARLGLAVAQSQSGEGSESLDNATKVAAAAREHGDMELLIPSLRLLASLAFFRGDLAAASAHVDEAIAHVSAQEHPLALVDLLVARGSIDDERGDAQGSRKDFEQAVQLARTSQYLHGEASALVNLASVENGAGNLAAASADLRAGLDAASRSGDSQLENATLGDLGGVEANRGQLLSALSLFKRALALARTRGDTNLKVLIASRLVWTLAPFGRDADAQRLAGQILATANSHANPYWQAEAHFALAGLTMHGKNWKVALAELQQAQAGYVSAGMTRDLPEIVSLWIEAATQAGDVTQVRAAERMFRERSQMQPEAAQWKSWSPLLAAQLRAAAGDVAGATADLAHALDDARGAVGPVEQASLFELGRWQLALGRPADLIERPEWKPWLEQHPEAIELHIAALRAAGRDAEAQTQQARLDTLKHAQELAMDADSTAEF